MHIFHYHPETGLYLGGGIAEESPLEPGVYLIPAHATPSIAPLEIAGKDRYWTGATWEYRLIPEPPEPEPPPPEPTLDDLKALKIAEIDAKTAALTLARGFSHGGLRFSLEPGARQNWADMIASLTLMTSLLNTAQITPEQFQANFPVMIETIDKEPYALAGAPEVVAFWNSYLNAQRDPDSPLASGRLLRAQAAAATTKEDLEAIVDDRV